MNIPPAYPTATLYVGDLSPEVTEQTLYELFNPIGPISTIRVCRHLETRRSLGYAYVNFHNAQDAERVLDTLNYSLIRGKPCRIMWSQRDPSLRRSAANNIFVKNLDSSIDNKCLHDTFSIFGNIVSAKVAITPCQGGYSSLGYGYVMYETEEAAVKAIQQVNGMEIAGKKVSVTTFRSRAERGLNNQTVFTNIYVNSLPEDFNDEKLKAFFLTAGPINSAKMFNKYGFCNFENPEDAKKAISMFNGFLLDGKTLYVGQAQSKDVRERFLRVAYAERTRALQEKTRGLNLYVKNFDNVSDDELKKAFEKFGEIASAKVMFEIKDGQPHCRGFGFVCFTSSDAAQRAIVEMNQSMIFGKPLYVAIHVPKDVRRAQVQTFLHARRQSMNMYPAPQMFYQGMPPRMMYPPSMIPPRTQPQPNFRGPQPMMFQQPFVRAPYRGRGGSRGMNQRGRPSNPRGPRRDDMGMPQQAYQQMHAMPAAAPVPVDVPQADQKQVIGEQLYPMVQALQPNLAGKITGMLLDLDNSELQVLLADARALNDKVDEALAVLNEHQADGQTN